MSGLRSCAHGALGILSPAFVSLSKYSGKNGFHFVILDPNVERWEVNGDVERAILLDGFPAYSFLTRQIKLFRGLKERENCFIVKALDQVVNKSK